MNEETAKRFAEDWGADDRPLMWRDRIHWMVEERGWKIEPPEYRFEAIIADHYSQVFDNDLGCTVCVFYDMGYPDHADRAVAEAYQLNYNNIQE